MHANSSAMEGVNADSKKTPPPQRAAEEFFLLP
jgi:hypothetical protein